jgi:type II secretory pathway component GspD/PulD (secretin)
MRKHLARDLKRFRSRSSQFDALSRDAWIAVNSESEPQRLHALGVITFRWNTSEQLMFSLFAELLNASRSEAEILTHELGNIALVRRIGDLASIRFTNDQQFNDLIENVIAGYDVCRQNRNQFTHFKIQLALDAERTSDFDFVRRSKRADPPSSFVRFPDKLSDLRRVAKDIRRLNIQLKTVNDAVFLKRKPNAFETRPEREAKVKAAKKLQIPAPIWTPPPASK